MKKAFVLLAVCLFAGIFNQAVAQDEKPETKIFNMLNQGLGFTKDQEPKAQSLVGDFAKQFTELGKKQMMAAAKQKAQNALFSKFAEGLGKFITPAQLTKFNGIKETVKTALMALK